LREESRGTHRKSSSGKLKFGFLTNYVDFSLQVVENGYEYFADNKLVTLFSAPNYCAQFDNSAGSMMVNENLVCRIRVRIIVSLEFAVEMRALFSN